MIGRQYTPYMARLISYMRQHSIQRRLLTTSLSLAVGLLAALLAYPYLSNSLLIGRLASRRPAVREAAIAAAARLAGSSPRLAARLGEALDSDDDVLFLAAARALCQAGKFYSADRKPDHVDRLDMLNFIGTPGDASVRCGILAGMIRRGHDSSYVRRSVTLAGRDPSPAVRRLAAVLAAKLGADTLLSSMIRDDPDGSVAAAGAIAAAAGGRTSAVPAIAARLAAARDPEAVSSAAYALAVLAGDAYSRDICRRLGETSSAPLRDRLCYVATVLGDDRAKAVIGRLLARSLEGGTCAPAAVIAAASRFGLPAARREVRQITTLAGGEAPLPGPAKELRTAQIVAALDGAVEMGLDVSGAATRFCRRYWGPGRAPALMAAVRAIVAGRASRSAGPTTQPGLVVAGAGNSAAIEMLRLAADYIAPATSPAATSPAATGPAATGPARWIVTPLPSAAAAAALWRLSPADGADYVKRAAAGPSALPGDWLAWNIAAAGGTGAFSLGLEMLPGQPATSPAMTTQPVDMYNKNLRTTGAMLLALAAGSDEQSAMAAGRIEHYLARETGLFQAGAYKCALLVLGRGEYRPAVRELLATRQFSRRLALTALLAVGDKSGFDWLLAPAGPAGPAGLSDSDLAELLTGEALAEVLAACAPDLPVPSAWVGQAGGDLLDWRMRILRYTYAVRRDEMRLGLKR